MLCIKNAEPVVFAKPNEPFSSGIFRNFSAARAWRENHPTAFGFSGNLQELLVENLPSYDTLLPALTAEQLFEQISHLPVAELQRLGDMFHEAADRAADRLAETRIQELIEGKVKELTKEEVFEDLL